MIPTAAPTESPFPTFLNDSRCPLRIATSQCDTLVAANAPSQIVPDEDCTCYNFCGGEYVGCCGLRETCNIECDVNDRAVAGCRLDGIVDENEPACRVTLNNDQVLEFEEGEPLGDIISTDCGSSADFPCFCNSFSERNGIRCPYCSFDTTSGIQCIGDDESITFVASDGVEQTCTCSYLGNNLGATTCEPTGDPVEPVCALTRQTGQCPGLTEFINPMEDCDCYNFCDGEFVGCCKYGELCSAACPPGTDISLADLVTGCEIDPNRPPVTPPPIEPTQAPTMEPPKCLVEQNLENCPALTQGKGPDPDDPACGCYNYCGDRETSCCDYDDPTCSVRCSLLEGEVVTAGCQLTALPEDPTASPAPVLKIYGEDCASYAECASGRCYFKKCQREARIPTRTKLSGNRGGSAGGGTKVGGGGARGLQNIKVEKRKVRGL